MTARKDEIALGRTPAYPDRETGAAELCISPGTWDLWVENGILPQPFDLGISGTTPRWDWQEVRETLSKRKRAPSDPKAKPFFGELAGGQAKDKRRAAS